MITDVKYIVGLMRRTTMTKAKPKKILPVKPEKLLPVKEGELLPAKDKQVEITPSQNHSQSKAYSQSTKRNTPSRKITPSQAPTVPPPKGWLTTRQAATIIGCDRGHIRRLVGSGKLKGAKCELLPGTFAWFICPKSIDKFQAVEQTTGYPRGKPR